MTLALTREQICLSINELLMGHCPNGAYLIRIQNSVWREINAKQQIRPFTNETQAMLRISTLAHWHYREVTGNSAPFSAVDGLSLNLLKLNNHCAATSDQSISMHVSN